jgi:hypothetical protein
VPQQSAKGFAEALNKSLDEIGAPIHIRERSIILSKMLSIPKQQAWALLEGHIFPDMSLLQQIASELEIDLSSL